MPYLNTNTILNRIDSRLKLVMTLALIVITFFVSSWLILGLLLIAVIGLVPLVGIPILYGLKTGAVLLIFRIIGRFMPRRIKF